MAFSVYPPTPEVTGGTAYLVPVALQIQQSGGGGGGGGTSYSLTFTNDPTTGTIGGVIDFSGTVLPSGQAVEFGLSTNGTTFAGGTFAGGTLSAATVSGTLWNEYVTLNAAGTFYPFGEITGETTVVGAGIVVSAGASGVAFTYPPTAGQTGVDLSVFGTVSPSGSSVQVGWSTTNTTPPTSWTSVATNSGIWSGNITGPGSAGTYYLWAEIVGQSGTAVVSPAVTISAATGNVSIAFQTGTPAFSSIGYTAFSSTQTHGASGIVFQVETTPLSGSEVANSYIVSEVSATEPSSGGGALGAAGSGVLGVYAAIPSTPGTYYIQVFRRASAGGTLEAWMATTAITVT